MRRWLLELQLACLLMEPNTRLRLFMVLYALQLATLLLILLQLT